MIKKFFSVILALATVNCFATMFMVEQVIDPINGDSIEIIKAASFGGYIYQEPSKYDGVFWPYTVETYICFNPRSGYIAFGDDFENIENDEVAALKSFLENNYREENAPSTHIEKLLWLNRVYTYRAIDLDTKVMIYCLLSYLSRNDENEIKYKSIALNVITKYLETSEDSFQKAQLYVVSGFYNMVLGNTNQAERLWAESGKIELNLEEPIFEKEARSYLRKMIKELKSGKYHSEYYES